MVIHRAGADALLIDVDAPLDWFAELVRRRDAGDLDATEIVPGARSVLLAGLHDPAETERRLRGWRPAERASTPRSIAEIKIQVWYGEADLPTVARHWGVPEAEVVTRLANTRFTVAFCGFAPGFAYLTGLPAECAVPRLPSPRASVPAGAVALAGPYTGIYPNASPGGWLLVGRLADPDTVLFDPRRDPPALLMPGTVVRLAAA